MLQKIACNIAFMLMALILSAGIGLIALNVSNAITLYG